MNERQLIGQKAQEFCEDLWQRGDFWNFENSAYERAQVRTSLHACSLDAAMPVC